ncbi:MAG TPA: 5-(carboxyamino)imidazole ribonucleotide synthase [Hyphomicrobium sp.]|nr:5-(carboxyamino)imidazole ribonucleotide synthase [Hyphomicrobium sp.]HEX2842926.1 5-(carboxyamino)imidazole ribonucleotide synthase [Hyphomicrobium sp.]
MTALPPGSTIGILGGGQLGRMLALSAAQLGLKCHIYTDVPGGACDVAASATVGPFEDTDKIRAFAETVDVVTYEFENVPLEAAAAAESVAPVRPGPKALAVAQDRLEEKTFISALGIAVAPFASVSSAADLAPAARAVGETGILKTRRLGYDGKGQIRIKSAAELPAAFEMLKGAPSVLEGFVPFAYEVSVLVVRSLSGEIRFYDLPLNTHKDGILDTSTVPSPLSALHAGRACEMAAGIAKALDYVGVLGVEMFYLGPDAPEPLMVNEIAPRVHNSGHWTMDACLVSQFENHMRAVAGWPLGPTTRHADVTMTNLIGADVNHWQALAAEPDAALHLYGKPEARPGRKMGHVNRLKPRS